MNWIIAGYHNIVSDFKTNESMTSGDSGQYPEWDYFLNESVSDVVFVVEGRRLPALKQILGFRNKVFRAMFDNGFKESKDKEIVIEDTTYEAFKTLVQFLYVDILVINDDNDHLDHLMQVHRLADRYDARRLLDKVHQHLSKVELTIANWNLIAKVAFDYKIKELLEKAMKYLALNCEEFMKSENEKYGDIVFVSGQQRLPGLRIPILVRNNVLSAKLQDYLKTFDDEKYAIDISSLTSSFGAFKVCIEYFYSDYLTLDMEDDPDLIQEVYNLAHKFEDLYLVEKMNLLLCSMPVTHDRFKWLTNIAFGYQISGLMDQLTDYMRANLDSLLGMDFEELVQLNKVTYDRLFLVLTQKYTGARRHIDYIMRRIYQTSIYQTKWQ